MWRAYIALPKDLWKKAMSLGEYVVRVVGVDPGTKSFDVVCIEDGKVVYEKSLETAEVAKNPAILIEAIDAAAPDYVVGPSGYGVPITFGDEVRDARRFAVEVLLLSTEKDIEEGVKAGELGIWVYDALAKVVEHIVKSYGGKAIFIPSITLLPTIPVHRKINKVDMGTADKLAATFIAVYTLAQERGIPYNNVNALVVELGYGYNAVIAVKEGRIVDAVGGTIASTGTLTGGALDLEIAAHVSSWSRWDVFYGGIFHIGRTYDLNVFARAYEKSEEPLASLFLAYIEGVVKDIYRMLAVEKKVDTIVLTGRHSKIPLVQKLLREYIPDAEIIPSKQLRGASTSKEAGQGYAAIGEGAVGGIFNELVRHMGIDRACGTVVDYVYHPRAEEFRRRVVRSYVETVARPRLCRESLAIQNT